MCLKSCHLKSSIPARLSAEVQALVLTWLIGSPQKVNTREGCLPICFRNTASASSFKGTE